MKSFQKYSLKELNTFKVDSIASDYYEIESKEDLLQLFENKVQQFKKLYFLGNGSNLLLTKDIHGIVLKSFMKEIKIIEEDADSVLVEADSGVDWHYFVEWCLNNGYYGLENLALIPGLIGAAPVQNIGAYGAEQSDFFVSLEAFDFERGKFITFNKNECEFGYRNSVFKKRDFRCYFITKVQYRLFKKFSPNLKYIELKKYIDELNSISKNEISAKTIFEAVCEIRIRKLPDLNDYPNAGSFFKNPVINKLQLDNLSKIIENPIYYVVNDDLFKVPSAYLIEKAGLKGFSNNSAGISEKHALIIVNKGTHSGIDILEFSKDIISAVFDKFSILLEPEVLIW